jgi:hypothetical protein
MKSAASSEVAKINYGVIQKAMAFRVKYRLSHLDGGKTVSFIKIHIRSLGVHMKNRGGSYPNIDTLKGLCRFLIEKGFVREEADHQGVCVQDIPHSELREGLDALASFNRGKCSYPGLECLFDDRTLQYGTLSHSHLLLVLRAWLTGAKWELETKQGPPHPCDEHGRLDLTAVAEHPNAKEMAEVINEGLRMEVLSWKIYVEEPSACVMISNALNKNHEIVLRTAELTALECLRGELSLRMNARSGQEVCLESVRNALRSQLDDFVDEPDFLEMFEFTINLGGGLQSYIPGFMWCRECSQCHGVRFRSHVFKAFLRTRVLDVGENARTWYPTPAMWP